MLSIREVFWLRDMLSIKLILTDVFWLRELLTLVDLVLKVLLPLELVIRYKAKHKLCLVYIVFTMACSYFPMSIKF